MEKNNQELLLESLTWAGGDFVPNYGYYYGLINSKLIFFTSKHSPFILKSKLDAQFNYIIEGINYKIPTLIELDSIIGYHANSHLAYVTPIPFKLLVSNYRNYYYDLLSRNLKRINPVDSHSIETLLINSIDLTGRDNDYYFILDTSIK